MISDLYILGISSQSVDINLNRKKNSKFIDALENTRIPPWQGIYLWCSDRGSLDNLNHLCKALFPITTQQLYLSFLNGSRICLFDLNKVIEKLKYRNPISNYLKATEIFEAGLMA